MSQANGSNEPATPGTRLLARARRTGRTDPRAVLAIVLVWAVLTPLVLTPAILDGGFHAAIALVGLSAVLSLLPSLFRSELGTAAAICRIAALAMAFVAVIATGLHLWG